MKKKVKDLVSVFKELDKAMDQSTETKAQREFQRKYEKQAQDLQESSIRIKNEILGLNELARSGKTYTRHLFNKIAIWLSKGYISEASAHDLKRIYDLLDLYLKEFEDHKIELKIQSVLQTIAYYDSDKRQVSQILRYIDLIALMEYLRANRIISRDDDFDSLVESFSNNIRYYLDLLKIGESELNEWVSLTMNFSSKMKKRLSISSSLRIQIITDWEFAQNCLNEILKVTGWNDDTAIHWLEDLHSALSSRVDWLELISQYFSYKLIVLVRSSSYLSQRELLSNVFEMLAIVRPQKFISENEFYKSRKIQIEDKDRFRQFQIDEIRKIIERFENI